MRSEYEMGTAARAGAEQPAEEFHQKGESRDDENQREQNLY